MNLAFLSRIGYYFCMRESRLPRRTTAAIDRAEAERSADIDRLQLLLSRQIEQAGALRFSAVTVHIQLPENRPLSTNFTLPNDTFVTITIGSGIAEIPPSVMHCRRVVGRNGGWVVEPDSTGFSEEGKKQIIQILQSAR